MGIEENIIAILGASAYPATLWLMHKNAQSVEYKKNQKAGDLIMSLGEIKEEFEKIWHTSALKYMENGYKTKKGRKLYLRLIELNQKALKVEEQLDLLKKYSENKEYDFFGLEEGVFRFYNPGEVSGEIKKRIKLLEPLKA